MKASLIVSASVIVLTHGIIHQIVAGYVHLGLVAAASHMKRNTLAGVYNQLQLLLHVDFLVERADDEVLRVRFFQYHLDMIIVWMESD